MGRANWKNETENVVVRAPLPKQRQMIGMVEKLLGSRRMYVICSDGQIRNCRVPGKFARKLWIRPRDIVIIEQWEINTEKANVIYKYKSAQIGWLRRNNYLKFLD